MYKGDGRGKYVSGKGSLRVRLSWRFSLPGYVCIMDGLTFQVKASFWAWKGDVSVNAKSGLGRGALFSKEMTLDRQGGEAERWERTCG